MKQNNKLTDTEKKLREMLCENTGKHILDSGGAYGRHWQSNRLKDFDTLPEASLNIQQRGEAGIEIMVYVSLYHYLKERVTLDKAAKKYNRAFVKFERQEKYKYTPYSEIIKSFVQSVDGEFQYVEYTYGQDSFLGQDFQYHLWKDKEDNQMVFLELHNGCDARGGFTYPVCFAMAYEGGFYDIDRATIACENNHWWDFEGGYYGGWRHDDSPNIPNLEDFTVSPDNPNIDYHTMAYAMREYRALERAPRLPLMEGVKPSSPLKIGAGLIYTDDSGQAYCPICGGKLSAYAPFAS